MTDAQVQIQILRNQILRNQILRKLRAKFPMIAQAEDRRLLALYWEYQQSPDAKSDDEGFDQWLESFGD